MTLSVHSKGLEVIEPQSKFDHNAFIYFGDKRGIFTHFPCLGNICPLSVYITMLFISFQTVYKMTSRPSISAWQLDQKPDFLLIGPLHRGHWESVCWIKGMTRNGLNLFWSLRFTGLIDIPVFACLSFHPGQFTSAREPNHPLISVSKIFTLLPVARLKIGGSSLGWGLPEPEFANISPTIVVVVPKVCGSCFESFSEEILEFGNNVATKRQQRSLRYCKDTELFNVILLRTHLYHSSFQYLCHQFLKYSMLK